MAKTVKSRRSPATFTDVRDPAVRAQALETFSRAFSNYRSMESNLKQGVWQGKLFNPEHTRVAVADGRVVSGVLMAPRRVRFGSVLVPAMTVGPVGTHDFHRKQGYSAATMWDADRYMKEHGVLLAYLQGIPDFYHRFGYYPYRGQHYVRFRRDDARSEARPGRLRPISERDIPAVAAIYRRVHANRTMSAHRDRTLWRWLLQHGRNTWFFPSPHVISDARGRICGYLTIQTPATLGIPEIVVSPDEAGCRAALGALVREARRQEVKDLDLPIPSDDELAVFIRQHVGAEFVTRTHPTGGQLLAILDFPELMRRLEPVLSRRWRESATRNNVRFTLSSEIGAVGISITGRRLRVPIHASGRARRVHVPRRWLSGLLTSYYSVSQVASRKGAVIPPALHPVLDVLFPAGQAFICRGDNH